MTAKTSSSNTSPLGASSAQKSADAMAYLLKELPEWVDESILQEFLSIQRNVLDDCEGEILSIEKGADPADVISRFKRSLHTLKGESYVVGLTRVGEGCHELETFLSKQAPNNSPEYIEKLLLVLDWVRQELYGGGGGPLPIGDDALNPPVSASNTSITIPLQEVAEKTPIAPSSPQKDQKVAAPAEKPPESVYSAPAVLHINPAPAYQPSDGGEPMQVVIDDNNRDIIAEFIEENDEALSKADQILLGIDPAREYIEDINALFRVFHSIKGVTTYLGFEDISKLAHNSENLLDQLRCKKIILRDDHIEVILDATAVMRSLVSSVRRAMDKGVYDINMKEEKLVDVLERVKYLQEQKEVPVAASVPTAPAKASPPPVVAPVAAPVAAHVAPVAAPVAASAPTAPASALVAAATPPTPAPAENKAAAAAAADKGGDDANKEKAGDTIRVDLGRVDSLVEMIGELVIVESMLAHNPHLLGIQSRVLRNHLNQLAKISRDLQDIGMRMRMIPVRGVFQKMARIIRDVSKRSGKKVRLVEVGASTEMDRTMVESLSDPLVHMIRNSVDHGVEPPEERKRVGKPEEGTVTLAAYHQGSSIIIEVQDDGRGLNRDAILRKAISQGMIKETDQLADSEVYQLIFAPGFSTAAQITEISGRGVGMDVVKRNIEAMRGRINIETVQGQGTCFKICLPLTLAIIDGMLITCGPEKFIIPTLSIVESVQPTPDMLVTIAKNREMLHLRDQIIPMCRLSAILDIEGAKENPVDALAVIVDSMGHKVAVLVDDVIAQQQVVIKSLGPDFSNIRHLAGAAILSDGRVGLILNVDGLSELMAQKHTTATVNAGGYRSAGV